LSVIGGQGVFVKEVQAAVLDGRADIAVHSAKDLTSVTEPGLALAAVPLRGDPRDALVGSTLAALPTGGLVATGSVRRRAQLAHARPDLTFAELRGNIGTRLDKAVAFDAIVMAAAPLYRLGLSDRIAEVLDPDLFVPQGALAVECRAGDAAVLDVLAPIEHSSTRRAVDAERAFLAELGGGCSLPVGAYAVEAGDGLRLTAIVASLDGRIMVRHTATGTDAVALGQAVAAHLMDEDGGRSLLGDSSRP
jgi:hydroxymethylbilane synthase